MKKLFLVLLLLVVKNKLIAQTTIIPDYRFEQALIDLGIDSNQTINGQISNDDALLVTELNLTPSAIPNYPYPANDFYDGLIHNLSGIEAFINLEHLVVNVTMIDNLNLNNLVQLKYLDCVDNMLTSINVANNPLLEYINITSGGDVFPFNDISEIDLTNNPIITTLIAPGIDRINLNNSNNLQNMLVNVSCNYCWDYPPDFIVGTVCINVDNVELAQNNQLPYSTWTLNHNNININYTNELNQCSLGTSRFSKENISIYPNPIQSDILYLNSNGNVITKIIIFDLLGRKILEYKDNITDSIDISSLQSGNYILKVITSKGEKAKKLIVE